MAQKSWLKEEESSAIRVVELVVSLAIKLVLYKEATLLQELIPRLLNCWKLLLLLALFALPL